MMDTRKASAGMEVRGGIYVGIFLLSTAGLGGRLIIRLDYER